jgi:hypothetical protein
MVKNIKASTSLLFMMLAVCCFIELFNVHNSENEMFALMASFNVCMILAYLLLRWAK